MWRVWLDTRVAIDDTHALEGLLPALDSGPEGAYTRSLLIEQLEEALESLPLEQRDVFWTVRYRPLTRAA